MPSSEWDTNLVGKNTVVSSEKNILVSLDKHIWVKPASDNTIKKYQFPQNKLHNKFRQQLSEYRMCNY